MSRALVFRNGLVGVLALLLLPACAQKPATSAEAVAVSAAGKAALSSRLQAGEWQVEEIDRAPLVSGSLVTLRFGADQRVTGRASCNSYNGGYTLDGERLRFSPAAVTRRSCIPPLMEQEERFLKFLPAVQGLRLLGDGRLELQTADGRKLLARGGR